MNRSVLTIGLAISCLVALWWMEKPSQTSLETPSSELTKFERGERRKLEILNQTRKDIAEIQKRDSLSNKDSPCLSIEDELMEWRRQDFLAGRVRIRNLEGCFENKKAQELSEKYHELCNRDFSSLERNPDKELFQTFTRCLEQFSLVRALIVAERSKNIPSQSITDPRLLMDKIIAAFTMSDFAAAVEAADQLARIEPELYEAQKARVVSRFIVSHLPNQEDADWELLDEIMDNLQEFNSNDPELLDVWVMVKTRAMRDSSALPEIIEILKSRADSRALGFYVEASQVRGDKKEWSIATVDQAIALLNESLRLDPQEERFQKSKAQLLKIKTDLAQGKKSKDWVFSFNFGARFDLD